MYIYGKSLNPLITPQESKQLEPDDEVIIITHQKNIEALQTMPGLGFYDKQDDRDG